MDFWLGRIVRWSGSFYLPSLLNGSVGCYLSRSFLVTNTSLGRIWPSLGSLHCSVIKGLLGGAFLEAGLGEKCRATCLGWLAQVALPLPSDSQLMYLHGFSCECSVDYSENSHMPTDLLSFGTLLTTRIAVLTACLGTFSWLFEQDGWASYKTCYIYTLQHGLCFVVGVLECFSLHISK